MTHQHTSPFLRLSIVTTLVCQCPTMTRACNCHVFSLLIFSTLTITASQRTESYGNAGRPVLGAKKKERVDLGPPILEENEVQILVDADWDENLLFHDVYLVLFYEAGCKETETFLAEYEAAADVLIVTSPYTPLAKVDCGPDNRKTVNICAKVTASLPSIRYFRSNMIELRKRKF